VTANFTISYVAGTGETFLPLSTTATGTYSVVAGYAGTVLTGKATLDVTP
jgi:hypothetical protein